MGLDTSKKMGHTNSETSMPATSPSPPAQQPQLPSPHSFDGKLQLKVVGETTAETVNLLSASIESCCSDSVQIDLLRSDLAGIKPVSNFTPVQYHVLAVDDSRFDRRVVEKLLKISSYKVTSVSSALKALEVLGLSENCSSSIKKNLDINLIITDYCMPEMTGHDLLKRVKAQSSPWRDIPVVIMSSENDSNRIRSCLAEGAEEFIIKPVRMADVKRLRGHIRPLSSTSSSGTADSSGSTSGKRKASEAHDTIEVTSSERRPRLEEVFVA